MFYNAKGGQVKIESAEMDYIVFGTGTKPLIIIPGLGDGLKSVKGQAVPLALYYKQFARRFRVYIFSRKTPLTDGYTIERMAEDLVTAMDILAIPRADIMGLSQGGMIAQRLGIGYPEKVDRLVIGVSVSRPNETLNTVVNKWISMAESDDYTGILKDTMAKTFTPAHQKRYRLLMPIASRIGKPKSFNHFLIQARACLNHNTYDDLDRISCPTLVIGGDSDHVAGKNTSEEMAEKIKNSKLVVYKGLGHGAYEETKSFNREILNFLS